MNEPFLDDEGYPTDEFLEQIEKFDLFKNDLMHENAHELIDTLEEVWYFGDWGFKKRRSYKGKFILELHTGGWSGNESIIKALNKTFFWSLYWVQSRRGGHYLFKIPFNTKKFKA
jgi:hypothetical protein